MRAAIYGAGSLGTILGAYITSKGGNIDLINHNVKHVQALNEKGAKIVGTVDFVQKVNAITDKQMTGKYDIIFLMTKQQGNSETVPFLKDYLEDDGVIVTLQNGLPEHQIADVVGEKRVIGCTVAWGATMLGPGVCELTSSPDSLTFSLGTIFSETPKPYGRGGFSLENDGTSGDRCELHRNKVEQTADQFCFLWNECGARMYFR